MGNVQTNQLARMCGYQSQVCTASGARPGALDTTVLHSVVSSRGAIAPSTSVRALRAAISSTRRPEPAAIPAISSAARGACAVIDSSARPPQ